MTTFKLDADFNHPTATVTPSRSRNGVHIKFPNEWVVSVQWGPGNYGSHHQYVSLEFPYPELEATTAEIAAWQGEGGMIVWSDGDSVQGWKTWDEVQRILDAAESGALSVVAADV